MLTQLFHRIFCSLAAVLLLGSVSFLGSAIAQREASSPTQIGQTQNSQRKSTAQKTTSRYRVERFLRRLNATAIA